MQEERTVRREKEREGRGLEEGKDEETNKKKINDELVGEKERDKE